MSNKASNEARAAARDLVLFGAAEKESVSELVNIRKYLEDVEKELKNGGMDRLQLTNSHRKTMLRALLGLTKVELDDQMRRERARLQYDQIIQFIENDLVPELEHGAVDETDAPHFCTALDKILTEKLRPTSTPLRASADGICSPMARGRVYKGKFVDLLSDLAPELVPNYHSAADVSEQDVMLSLVNNNLSQGIDVDVELCTKCIKCSLPDDKDDIENRKASDGLTCEAKCVDFLSGRSAEASRMILSNVFVKPRNSKKSSKKGIGGAVIVTSIDLDGTCSEFDAIVVEKVDDEQSRTTSSIRVCEVWEAKATISPLTIHDALTKKAAAMYDILANESTLLLLDRTECSLSGNYEPLFGIFGKELLPPKVAANQMKVVGCRNALSSDVHIVSKALETGYVEMSSDRSIQSIRKLQSVVNDFESLVVVAIS